MLRALGRLLQGGEVSRLHGGSGEPVPERHALREFHHLMSWKQEFLGNQEKREAIQVAGCRHTWPGGV